MIRHALVFLSWLLASAATLSAGETNFSWEFTDLDGEVHQPFEENSTRCLVLIFISTDCPIANGYLPILRRMAEKHQQDGVRFFMIHPNTTLSIEEARKHADEFGIPIPVVIDKDQSIARRAGATVTPQAFVFTRTQTNPVYQGRIDNLYAGYGKKRNVASSHDLEEALKATVAGRAVQEARTKAVGCFIHYVE